MPSSGSPKVATGSVLRRGGLTFRRLTAEHPHGVVLRPNLPHGVLKETVVYRGGRIRLKHKEIEAEIALVGRRHSPEGFPLRMIGMRELRSENSWMHKLAAADARKSHPARPHARRRRRRLAHRRRGSGAGDFAVRQDLGAGHRDKGHRQRGDRDPARLGPSRSGGWQVANRAGGANVNLLTSTAPAEIEPLAGMAWLTGVPVRVTPV